MSRMERAWRRAADRAGLGLVIAWPALCVVIAFGAWVFGG
jgi:hypothetical protein